MTLLAPVIAAVTALLGGLVALIWMNRSQPTLQKSPGKGAEPELQSSLEDIWRGKVDVPQGYAGISVHHE